MKNKSLLGAAAFAALATTGATAVFTTDAHAQATTSWNGAPETREGEQRFKLRGRFQYDILSSNWDTLAENGMRSYTRRAFIGAQGRFTDHWRYKIDFVLNPGAADISTTSATGGPDCNSGSSGTQQCLLSASGGADDVQVDDAFLEWVGEDFSIVIGEHNITSPLEDRTSSLDIQFNERSSFINAFEYGRAAGVGILFGGGNWSAAGAIQGDSLNNQDTDFAKNEMLQESVRVTWAPIFSVSPDSTTLLHLGASVRNREAADGANFRYRARPLNGRGTRWIDGGSGAGNLGQSDITYGVEAAFQAGPFGAQAEYSSLNGENNAGTEFDYSGYYVDLFWSLTGESRAYRGSTGVFAAIKPAHPVSEGGPGHWMLNARYDSLDLSDPIGGSSRGEQTAWAVGLGWVPVEHVMFRLNYADSDMDRVTGTDDKAQIISLRTQFDF